MKFRVTPSYKGDEGYEEDRKSLGRNVGSIIGALVDLGFEFGRYID